jgi:hypothetical protein
MGRSARAGTADEAVPAMRCARGVGGGLAGQAAPAGFYFAAFRQSAWFRAAMARL